MVIPCGIEDPNGLCPLECFLHSLCSAKGRGEPPQGRTPHFLFETSKRKPSRGASLAPSGQFTFCAVHGGKEKMSGMIWHLRVKSPKTEAGRHELPTKLETPLPAALYSFFPEPRPRICGHGAQRGAKQNRRISAPVRSASLRTTRFGSCFILIPVPLGEGFQRRGLAPVPRPLGRGFQRGGPRPAPLCHEGVWGTGGVPHVSGGGLRGRDLCAKGPFPLPRSGNCPLREQTVLSDFQIK